MPQLEKTVWEEIVVWDLEQTACLQDSKMRFLFSAEALMVLRTNSGMKDLIKEIPWFFFLAEMFHVPSMSFSDF